MPDIRAGYLRCVLEPAEHRRVVQKVVKTLRPIRGQFDCIAFRGMSGATVGSTVAYLLKKHSLMVRKETDHHSSLDTEGPRDLHRYVVVDDLVSSGKTIDCICQSVQKHNGLAHCAGVVLYNHEGYLPAVVEYFRRHKDLVWLTDEDFDTRAARLLSYASNLSLWSSRLELARFRVLGPCLSEGEASAVEVFFPRKPEQAKLQKSPWWSKLLASLAS